MKVYKLRDDFDYKNHLAKYRAVVTLNPQDGFEVAGRVRRGKGKPLLSNWDPPLVRPYWEELDKPLADISFIGVSGPITVTAKARNALQNLLEASGELLPLQSEEGEYFIHNVTTVIDAFDLEKGAFRWIQGLENKAMSRPEIFEFRKEALDKVVAFRFVYYTGDCFYTDIFKQCVEEADLKGLDFQLIWDSENPDYHDERYTPEQWERVKKQYGR